ncbi:mechanosensitive ion channel family protein [Myroides sp. M-43]|uniref:mechanosensitive ion channel domain-containing protein n=1 Tax=Myroides oncorhynchi TaxID=2893756 RepID=UPI001E536322|nr:mechanosensitive ion channel domain-containing protein [Myroides oncorhynchi]MCC9043232.1 mechanosensitive ion channel family protein [Myroides oncorhynchi]
MLKEYYTEIIATAITLALYIPFRKLIGYIIRSFSTKEQRKDSRVLLIIRLFNTLLSVIFLILILTIWGVEAKNFMFTLTSVFTVIGVAMFAQWSLLSNITAGILLFFSFPFRIGDTIRIQDKDFPIEAQILDIKAFCTILLTIDNEKISYPNSLLLQKGIVIVDKKEDTNTPTI